MLALAVSPSTHARVWIDERPPFASYAPDAELAGEVAAGAIAPVASEVIVEVAANVGPFVRYGLLGVSAAPSPQGRVGIRVPYVRGLGPVIQTPLVGPPEAVTLGLADEFAAATLDALARAAIARLASCDLSIRYACCGGIGSNSDWMARIATAAVEIAAAPVRSRDEVIACLRGALGLCA